jgi:hypothetical protein
MKKPPLDPDGADLAPADPVLTTYDEEHFITYLRLLDAHNEGRRLAGGVADRAAHRPGARPGLRKTSVRQSLIAR